MGVQVWEDAHMGLFPLDRFKWRIANLTHQGIQYSEMFQAETIPWQMTAHQPDFNCRSKYTGEFNYLCWLLAQLWKPMASWTLMRS